MALFSVRARTVCWVCGANPGVVENQDARLEGSRKRKIPLVVSPLRSLPLFFEARPGCC